MGIVKYSKEELNDFKLTALKKMATENGIDLPEKVKKATIIDLLLNPKKELYTITEASYLKIEGDSLQYKDVFMSLEGSIWNSKGSFWLVPSHHREKLEEGIENIKNGVVEKEVEIVSEKSESSEEKSDSSKSDVKKMSGKDDVGNIITLELIGDEIVIEGKSFKIKDKIKECGGKWNASKKHWAVKNSTIDVQKLFSNLGLKK